MLWFFESTWEQGKDLYILPRMYLVLFLKNKDILWHNLSTMRKVRKFNINTAAVSSLQAILAPHRPPCHFYYCALCSHPGNNLVDSHLLPFIAFHPEPFPVLLAFVDLDILWRYSVARLPWLQAGGGSRTDVLCCPRSAGSGAYCLPVAWVPWAKVPLSTATFPFFLLRWVPCGT